MSPKPDKLLAGIKNVFDYKELGCVAKWRHSVGSVARGMGLAPGDAPGWDAV